MREIQPAREIIKESPYTVTGLARAMGVTRNHLQATLLCSATPAPVVREQLPKLLGVPLEDLYTPALLARRWSGTRPGRAKSVTP